MSLSSYLTCNLVARQRQRQRQRGAVEDDDPYDYDGPQPQTATCCTALQRGLTGDGHGHGLLAHPRYAPLRTPGSATALLDPPAMPTTGSGNDDDRNNNKEEKKAQRVRKCKSTVQEVDVIQGPRLRRSGGVRRDWSFEDIRANNAAA